MFLHGEHPQALAGGVKHRLLVQRLDGGHIDDPHVDALLFAGHGGAQRLAGHQAGGEHGDVKALGELFRLADFKGISAGVMEHRGGQTADPDVDGAVVGVGGAHGGAGLHVVGGVDDHHVGDGAHQGDVLAHLMGGAVLPHRQARVAGNDLDVELRVGDGVADLVVGAAGGEHGKAGGEGGVAHAGQTRSHAHHVLLGNAAVEEPVGVLLPEQGSLGGGGQVRVQHHNVVMAFLGQLHQRAAVAVTGGDFFHLSHCCARPPSLTARRRCAVRPSPFHTRRHWGLCRASPPRSPCS